MCNRLLLGIALSIAIAGGCGGVKQPAQQPPVVSAGTDQTVKVGATVLLNGKGSHDPQGLPLHFYWKLTPPSGSKAALANAFVAQPSFVADLAGRYDVTLTVDDGALTSPSASIVVSATADNLEPVANAGSNRAVKVGAVVQLDGSASSDADGDAITYRWA
jgi:PKD domain